MALKKDITQPNGITTSYHRIMFLQSMINSHVSIAVLSYVDEDNRRTETDEVYPYKIAITYEKPYQENMTIEEAYAYLKTRPEFEGAEDI